MEEELIRLYNGSKDSAMQMVDGKRVILGGFEEGLYSRKAAKALMVKYPGTVTISDDAGLLPQEAEVLKPKTLWVANVTGDPRYPAKIKKREFVDKRWTTYEDDNPVAKAMPLQEKALGSWFEYQGPGGLYSGREANKSYVIMPYRRVEMDVASARWFVNRSRPVGSHGSSEVYRKAIISRKSDFEPGPSWSLDELIAYLSYIDTNASLPPTEAKVRATAKRGHATKEAEDFKVLDAAREMRKRLYYYVVDPKVKLPTREEFEQFMLGVAGRPGDDNEALAEELVG